MPNDGLAPFTLMKYHKHSMIIYYYYNMFNSQTLETMEAVKTVEGFVAVESIDDVVYKELIELLIEESTAQVKIGIPGTCSFICITKDNILPNKFKIILKCMNFNTLMEVGETESMYVYPDNPLHLSDLEVDLYNIFTHYQVEASKFDRDKFEQTLEKEYQNDLYDYYAPTVD